MTGIVKADENSSRSYVFELVFWYRLARYHASFYTGTGVDTGHRTISEEMFVMLTL